MIKPTHWLVLGLLGSALATVVVQNALKSDGSAAVRPVTERTDPSHRTAPKLGRAFLGNSDETADTGDATMPGRTGWTRPATRPVNGVGRFNNQQSNPSAFQDTGAGYDTGAGMPTATMFGLALPRSRGAVAGGSVARGAGIRPVRRRSRSAPRRLRSGAGTSWGSSRRASPPTWTSWACCSTARSSWARTFRPPS